MSSTGILQNVEAHWASVREVNDMSGAYEVEVHNLTPEQEKYITSFGQGKPMWTEVRTSAKYPEKGRHVKFKTAKPPKVIDGLKNELPLDVKVGNGSIVNIQFIASAITYRGETKVKLTLLTLQVLKLVEFKDDLPVVKGEYQAPTENKSLDNTPLEEVN